MFVRPWAVKGRPNAERKLTRSVEIVVGKHFMGSHGIGPFYVLEIPAIS